jgi:prepilin-type N-terminal cleavage/methylation domain-containing protein
MSLIKKNKAFSLVELAVVILIIGILVAAVSQGGKLVTKSKISAAKSKTASSPLLNNLDMVDLWLETSTSASFDDSISDGVKIAKWNSLAKLSSQKNISGIVESSPEYKININNGLPAVVFDNNFLSFMEVLFINGLTSYSFIVVQSGLPTFNTGPVFTCTDNLNTNTFSLSLKNDTNLVAIHTYTYNSQDGVKYFINGGAEATLPTGGNANLYNADNNTKKCNIGNSSYAGSVFEIIILSRKLSNDDLNDIHKYLSSKHKISNVVDIN